MIEALLALPAWTLILAGIVFIALFFFTEYEKPGWATLSILFTAGALQVGHFFDFGVNVFGFMFNHPFYTLLIFIGWFVAGGFWSVIKWWFFVRRLRDKYEELKRNFLKSHGIEDTLTIPPELKERFFAENHRNQYDRAIGVLLRTFPDYDNAASVINNRVGKDIEEVATSYGVDVEALRDLATFTDARPNVRKDLLSLRLPDEMKARFTAELNGPEMRAAIIPSPRNHKWRITMWMVWWPWSMIWTLLNDPIRRIWRSIWKLLQSTFTGISKRAFRNLDDDLISHEEPTEDLKA